MKIDYNKQMLAQLEGLQGRPLLLLHSCCAPCSSHVLTRLSPHFDICLYFYNPNIAPEAEYRRRFEEQQRLVSQLPLPGRVWVREGPYDPEAFYAAAAGLEDAPEGGERCQRCFDLRLRQAAQAAKQEGADFFTTTLTISPHKNPQVINPLGQRIGAEYGVAWLCGDFKKQNGYLHSLQLSAEYGLYRQDYCGCVFSRKDNVE